MAAATATSPPPAASSTSSSSTRKPLPRPHLPADNLAIDEANGKGRSAIPLSGSGSPRIRDAPASPVRVNHQINHWAQPYNADIEHAHAAEAEFDLSGRQRDRAVSYDMSADENLSDSRASFHDARDYQPQNHDRKPLPDPPASSGTIKDTSQKSRNRESNGNFGINFSSTEASLSLGEDLSGITAHDSSLQEDNRHSRESDTTTSTNQQQVSTESSATTSASSVSGVIETPECQENGSAESSLIEGHMPRHQSVPLFQYHHQQQKANRVSSFPTVAGSSSDPDLAEAAAINRHLTPASGNFVRRDSLARPPSVYSAYSDFGPRGRSPGLMPGGSHMRAPSVASRRSPETRPVSYAEMLNVPYPQPAPAPVSFDNTNLRNVVGTNASLLSTQKTLEMYRQNVKKTNDLTIQYSFAVFLISTAQEQGLNWDEPAPKKDDHNRSSSPRELVKEARQILQKLASAGYPFAQYYLGDGYASGLFNKGKEDYSQAFPLFVLAAKHGHAESAYRSALCYEFSWGCRKDPTKAVQMLRISASKRHPGAMTRLGKACLSGDLGEKRYREGVKWMKLAAEAADSIYNAAPYQLGCLYETGYGPDVFKDEGYAAELFTQAAELGHPEANFRMGDAYEHGKLGCPKDPALSVHFYTGAAENGHAPAMMGLCAWYMVGAAPILEKDEEEAYEWARRSAELGMLLCETWGFGPLLTVATRLRQGTICRRLLHRDGYRLPPRHPRS